MNKIWVMAAAGSLLSVGAMAQANAGHPRRSLRLPLPPLLLRAKSLRQQMTSDMQKAGFTDVKVRPDSFLVQAKDKNGTPVTMLIDPDSVTEIVSHGGSAIWCQWDHGGQLHHRAGQRPAELQGGRHRRPQQCQPGYRHHQGRRVCRGSIKAYIVGVGGFLGMGDHYVAVSPSAINMSYDNNAHRPGTPP